MPRTWLLVVLTLLAGCGGRSSAARDEAAVDAAPRDRGPGFPDLPGRPDVRPVPTCFNTCPPVSGSKICLQGQVFDAPALLGYWAGVRTLVQIQYESIVTTATDGAVVRVYDPIDFVSNPGGAQPLAEVDIDDNGCFVVTNVSIPFSNLFAIAVDDKLHGGTKWTLTATGVTPTAGANSTGLLVPAVSEQTAADWGHSFLAAGTMLAMFRHRITGRGVGGVVPTFDGKPPVKSADGNWEFAGTKMDVFYVAADPTNSKAIVDPTADKTTKSGIALIRKMEVKSFAGVKTGCTIESELGGSSPGTLFLRILDVEGC